MVAKNLPNEGFRKKNDLKLKADRLLPNLTAVTTAEPPASAQPRCRYNPPSLHPLITRPAQVKLEHVGIAVSDITASIRLFEEVLGARPYRKESVESEGVVTHFYDAGGTKIELLESVREDSAIARFLERRGPGIHHLAFAVDDVDEAHRQFNVLGLRVLGDAPKPGADGKMIFFVHPGDTEGVLMEFCGEREPAG